MKNGNSHPSRARQIDRRIHRSARKGSAAVTAFHCCDRGDAAEPRQRPSPNGPLPVGRPQRSLPGWHGPHRPFVPRFHWQLSPTAPSVPALCSISDPNMPMDVGFQSKRVRPAPGVVCGGNLSESARQGPSAGSMNNCTARAKKGGVAEFTTSIF
jgi:hypothetical protein